MLKDKALASLAAGDLLLAGGIPDDAASRYYYAMYRAAVHALTKRGKRPGSIRSGAIEWDHSMIENNAGMLRRRPDDRWLYVEMRNLRTLADYRDETVSALHLRCRIEAVRDFVKEFAR